MMYSLCSTAYGSEPYKLKQEFSITWGWIDDDGYNWSNSDYYYRGYYSGYGGYGGYGGYYGGYGSYYYGGYGYLYDVLPNTPLDRYNYGNHYYDKEIQTQAITLSYTREIKRWLALSINASYSGAFRNEHESATGKISDKYSRHRIAVFPMVRFTYLNRPFVRLYSGVGFGLGLKREGWSNRDNYEYKSRLDGQATFFGVSVGKKIFASWEIGAGAMGYLTVSGGYRF
jgi:hypothetical protein